MDKGKLAASRAARRYAWLYALLLVLLLPAWAGSAEAAGSDLSVQDLAGVWLVGPELAGPSGPPGPPGSQGPQGPSGEPESGPDNAQGPEGKGIVAGSYFLFDPARNLVVNFPAGLEAGLELLYISDQSSREGQSLVFNYQGQPVLSLERRDENSLRLRNRGLELDLTRVDGDIAAIRDQAGLAGLWAVDSSTRGADVTSLRYARISNYPPRLDYESRWGGGRHRRVPIRLAGESAAVSRAFICRLPDSQLRERDFIASPMADGRLSLADDRDRVLLARSEQAELTDPELSRLDGYWITDWEESVKYMDNLPEGGLDGHSLFYFRGVTPVTLAFANLGGRLDHVAEPWNFDEQASFLPIRIVDKSYVLDYGNGGSRTFTLLEDDLLLVHYVDTIDGQSESTTDAVLRRIIDCRNP